MWYYSNPDHPILSREKGANSHSHLRYLASPILQTQNPLLHQSIPRPPAPEVKGSDTRLKFNAGGNSLVRDRWRVDTGG